MFRIIKPIILAAMLFAISSFAQMVEPVERTPPADYKSDGCSMFPDGNYRDCCVAHDRAYYFGGTRKERRTADRVLHKCVRGKGNFGNKLIAPMMWIGVRIGGLPTFPTPFRWGFGMKKKESVIRAKISN